MKTKRILFFLICVALLSTSLTSTVYAMETKKEADKTYAPYFFIENEHPEAENFPLKKIQVSNLAIGTGYTVGSEPGAWISVILIISFTLISLCRKHRQPKTEERRLLL